MKNNLKNIDRVLDLFIIGGGITGLCVLRQALKKGLDAIIVEKQNQIGGLWCHLPSWQDLQIRPVDWSLPGHKLSLPDQASVLKNIQSFADSDEIRNRIFTSNKVVKTEHLSERWNVSVCSTNAHQLHSRTISSTHLAVCTGIENKPNIPRFQQDDGSVQLVHSHDLHNPETLSDKNVVILGAGASAMDAICLSFKQKCKSLTWIARSYNWFTPSMQDKTSKPYMRAMALAHALSKNNDQLSKNMHKFLKAKYEYFKIEDILPDRPYNVEKEEITPGRPDILKNYNKIKKIKGEIQFIKDGYIITDSSPILCDVLVLATGYTIDLSFLGLEKFSNIQTSPKMREHLSSWIMSKDYPNLYFLGPQGAKGPTSTPWAAALIAKTMVSQIKGEISLSKSENVLHNIYHWEYLDLMARWDKKNHPPFFWEIKKKTLAWYYNKYPNKIVKV